MRQGPGLTVASVTAALRSSAGIRSLAAEQLRVTRSAITKFMQRHPEMEEIEQAIRDDLLDLTEGKLLQKIKDGDGQMIRYYLDNHGGERGYGRKVTLKGDPDHPVATKDVSRPDLSKLSVQELRTYYDLLQKARPDVAASG